MATTYDCNRSANSITCPLPSTSRPARLDSRPLRQRGIKQRTVLGKTRTDVSTGIGVGAIYGSGETMEHIGEVTQPRDRLRCGTGVLTFS